MKCVSMISASSTLHHHQHYTVTLILNNRINIHLICLLLCNDKSGHELDFSRSILLPCRPTVLIGRAQLSHAMHASSSTLHHHQHYTFKLILTGIINIHLILLHIAQHSTKNCLSPEKHTNIQNFFHPNTGHIGKLLLLTYSLRLYIS